MMDRGSRNGGSGVGSDNIMFALLGGVGGIPVFPCNYPGGSSESLESEMPKYLQDIFDELERQQEEFDERCNDVWSRVRDVGLQAEQELERAVEDVPSDTEDPCADGPHDGCAASCMNDCEALLDRSSSSNVREGLDPSSSYYDVGGIETIDIIKAKLTPEEYKGFLKGNILKYTCRMSWKHEDQSRDIEKVAFYSRFLEDFNG